MPEIIYNGPYQPGLTGLLVADGGRNVAEFVGVSTLTATMALLLTLDVSCAVGYGPDRRILLDPAR